MEEPIDFPSSIVLLPKAISVGALFDVPPISPALIDVLAKSHRHIDEQ